MATLSWEDIVNKQFRITKFAEGYLREEVDDYLDDVAEELRRLTAENEQLRARLEDSGGAPAGETVAQPDVAPAASVPAEQAPAPADEATSAAGVLAMAQRLHDEYVAEGEQRRAALLAEGQEKAQGLVTEAEQTRSSTLARLESDKADLERRIQQLRGFEDDYRSRLRSLLEGQLEDLKAQPRVEPASGPASTGADATA